MKAIEAAIDRLSKTHAEHISQYGTDNDLRLTGKHETCDMNTFRSAGMQQKGMPVWLHCHKLPKTAALVSVASLSPERI